MTLFSALSEMLGIEMLAVIWVWPDVALAVAVSFSLSGVLCEKIQPQTIRSSDYAIIL